MEEAGWYTINNAAEIDSPALILYPDRVKSNIKLLKTFVSDIAQLRPHVKTNKCGEVIKMMLDAGIAKFKCATIAEAELLGEQGATDVLLAYQPVGPKAVRFCKLQQQFPATVFSCLIDREKTLMELSEIAKKYDLRIPVFIDLNVGMNRTGISPGKAGQLYEKAGQTAGIEIRGFHAYDGHIHDADPNMRKSKFEQAFSNVSGLRNDMEKKLGRKPILVAGGTPTFPLHAKNEDVECSPGTFVFWDKGYQQFLSDQPFQFAALVMTRVISKPDAETICLDLGHKAIASENPLAMRVYFLNAPELEPVGHSEEHLVLRAPKGNVYQVGDVLYGVPHHICPTVALYDVASVCSGNVARSTWKIAARKRKISI
jgi:D-serine deaminase-like pyridoxal phosphate-dependent protein